MRDLDLGITQHRNILIKIIIELIDTEMGRVEMKVIGSNTVSIKYRVKTITTERPANHHLRDTTPTSFTLPKLIEEKDLNTKITNMTVTEIVEMKE